VSLVGRLTNFAIAAAVVARVTLAAAAAVAAPPPFTTQQERCIAPAARYHSVNPYVLRAILVVESGLQPRAVGRNSNGTLDVGMGQMNSAHFKELAGYGISPANLLDPCVSTYVAAWHLRKAMAAGGNTWEGVAKYHSSTPYFNRRYQILLHNELVRARVIAGNILPVPPLKSAGRSAGSTPPAAAVVAKSTADRPSIAFDKQ